APVSLLSDASLDELARQSGESGVDGRRFRMLIHLAGCQPHEEDSWIGRRVRVGEALVRVTEPNARCRMTTRNPDTGIRDFDTLRAIKNYRGVREKKAIDFGVYAEVEEPGRVAVGDAVEPV
nr:MOSC domain-containing protein [Actinomycetota bacterium]